MHITSTDEDNYHKRELWLDDGTCVSRLTIIDLVMRIGSTPVSMAGIGGVHTDRQHRKKGYMRDLYDDSVTYMVEQGYCVSALFGIKNFYTKWGYASSLAEYISEVKTRDAEAAQGLAKAYTARPVEQNDMPAIVNLYNQNTATRTGSLVRAPEHYTEFRKGTWWQGAPDAVLWEDAQGNLQAYAVWDRNDNAVKVGEVAAVDDSAYPTILYALAEQAVAKRCETIKLYLPVDHPFAEYAQRYGAKWKITFPRNGSGMMRIINQQPLFNIITPELEHRIVLSRFIGYTGTLTLETDLGTTQLVIENGHIVVADGESSSYKLALPQQKLMQLLVGYRSVRDVVNDVDVRTSGDAIPLLQALFPKGMPFMFSADHF